MRKRELLKGVCLLGGIVLAFAACNKTDDGPVLDFNITVPPTWNYFVLSNEDLVYYASSPLENMNDSIMEDVLVSKDKATGVGLEQFSSAIISSLNEDTSFHALRYTADTTINGETCNKLIHLQVVFTNVPSTSDSVALNAKIVRYFYVHNNYGYVVSMNALVDTYPTYKPIFETIISSFSFKN